MVTIKESSRSFKVKEIHIDKRDKEITITLTHNSNQSLIYVCERLTQYQTAVNSDCEKPAGFGLQYGKLPHSVVITGDVIEALEYLSSPKFKAISKKTFNNVKLKLAPKDSENVNTFSSFWRKCPKFNFWRNEHNSEKQPLLTNHL